MELISQPFESQLGDRLIGLLGDLEYDAFNIVVAFARTGGVLRLKDALNGFRSRGGTVTAHVGVDMGGTSYEALVALLACTDSLSVVHFTGAQTFHPKIYQFVGKERSVLIAGSHNLTAGGLWTNFESSLLLRLHNSTAADIQVLEAIRRYIKALTSIPGACRSIHTHKDIDDLLRDGHAVREVAAQLRRLKVAHSISTATTPFAAGVPTRLPPVAPSTPSAARAAPSNAPPAPSAASPDGAVAQTIWFETRSMTGGSRNILDLSMRSVVERGDPAGTPIDQGSMHIAGGAVKFFGVSPSAIGEQIDIRLHFEGEDYAGNTILFPTGQKANGTWRLQIKGMSASGVKITEALKEKAADFLTHKVAAFTRVTDDYYLLSVYPERDLGNFITVSRVVARNGASPSSKRFGIL